MLIFLYTKQKNRLVSGSEIGGHHRHSRHDTIQHKLTGEELFIFTKSYYYRQ
jgi:hypothetical protein